MRTIGVLLKEERIRKGFTFEQVEKATKIRAKFLAAIEEDDYKKLPALPYITGFIRNYSNFLGLRSTTIMAMFRRQYIQKERQNTVPIEEPLTNSSWVITPNKVILVAVVLVLLVLFGYFFKQFQLLQAPPPLTLTQPKPDLIVSEATIAVFGDTDADASLTINNEPVLVKTDGKFYKDELLALGKNTLVVEATNRNGKKTTITRMVTRTP